MALFQLLVIVSIGVAFASNLGLDRGPDGLHGHWSAARLVGSLGGFPLVFGNEPSFAQQIESKGREDQCCLPDAFELTKYETAAQTVGQHSTVVRVVQHASLDKVNMMVAVNQTEWIGSSPKVNLYMIFDITKKTLYLINAERTCSVAHELPTASWNSCFPPGSELVSTVLLGTGSSQAGLFADVWEVPISSGPFAGQRAHVVATPKDCTPVSDSFAGRSNDGTQAVSEFGGIFNFTVGIKDAKVFEVPPPCEVSKRGDAIGAPRVWSRLGLGKAHRKGMSIGI